MWSESCAAYVSASTEDNVLGTDEHSNIKMVVSTGDNETLTFKVLVYPGQEFYLSGLTATEQVYTGSYCEDFYNLLDDNKAFESSEAEVKEFTVTADKAGRYKFGYTANVPVGTQAKVTVLSGGKEIYRASIATEGAWERFQTEVVLAAETEATIRIETPTGTTLFEDMYLFQSKYAYVYNPNDYTDYTYKAAPARNATYAADSAVKLSVAGEAITNDFAGFGGIYYAYNYIPDSKNRTYTAEMQELELARLKASGTTVVRTQFSPAWAWDEETDTWNWESEEMQGFYQYMADMKANGIDVAINTDWSMRNVRASMTTGNYENPFYILGDDDASRDAAFVDWVKTAVTTIRGKGYDNLKYLFMFTEPVRTTDKTEYDTQFALWKSYVVAVDSALETAGIRDDVKMVGFNTVNYNSTVANQNGISDWYPLEMMAADGDILDAIDIFTHHAYVSNSKETDNYSTWYDYMSKCVEISKSVNKPFWFDEGEWTEKNPDSWTEGLSSGYHGLQLGVKMLAAMNSGLQGMMRWTLVDQYWMNDVSTKEDYRWTQGCHIWGVLPNMYTSTIPRNSYYAYSLFAKYTNGDNVQVYQGTESDGVYIASVKNGDETTVFVINMNNSAKEIEVTLADALESQNLNRHTYSAINNKPTTAAHIADSDLTLKSVTNKFNDKISAHSIYVYTTAE